MPADAPRTPQVRERKGSVCADAASELLLLYTPLFIVDIAARLRLFSFATPCCCRLRAPYAYATYDVISSRADATSARSINTRTRKGAVPSPAVTLQRAAPRYAATRRGARQRAVCYGA